MKRIAWIALAFALSGCATQRFEVQPTRKLAPSLDVAQPFFLSGIGQSYEVDAAKVCGGAARVRSVETESTPANIGWGVLTFGIYTPRQLRVYCVR